MKPLNGEKTHPLSAFAFDWLSRIAKSPVPRQELNPGVVNRLLRENLVEEIDLPSPYKSHKGRLISFVRITLEGSERLSEGVQNA